MPNTYLEPGSTDTASVKKLQDFLVGKGYLTQAQVNTGYGTYGPQTTAAVAKLQKDLGVDNSTGVGYFGPRTIAALNGATGSQANAIGASVGSGNVNQYGVPNDIGSILGVSSKAPSPGAPIDASALGNGAPSKGFNDILGAALSDPNPNSSIAGLLSLYGVSTDQQKEYDKANQELLNLTKSLGTEDADLAKALESQGVPAAFQQVKELNLQAAQLKGELDAFDVDTEKGLASIEDQPVTARVVSGQQAKLQKQRNLEKMSKAAELSAIVGLSQAYQGNAELGQKLAEQSVSLKYAPIKSAITVLQTQLKILGDSADKKDASNAKIISGLISLKSSALDKAEANDKQIQTLAIQAATNGAPASVVRAIQASADPVAAAAAGAQWIKGNLESTGGNGSSQFTTTQLNGGASKAGLSTADFGTLAPDVQNYFVNNKGASEAVNDINKIANGSLSLDQFNKDIDSSGLPASVISYLKQRAQAAAPAANSGGGGFLGGVGDFFGNIFGGVRSVLGF